MMRHSVDVSLVAGADRAGPASSMVVTGGGNPVFAPVA